MARTCRYCAAFLELNIEKIDGVGTGICRRRAPANRVTSPGDKKSRTKPDRFYSEIVLWPEVRASDTCCDWMPDIPLYLDDEFISELRCSQATSRECDTLHIDLSRRRAMLARRTAKLRASRKEITALKKKLRSCGVEVLSDAEKQRARNKRAKRIYARMVHRAACALATDDARYELYRTAARRARDHGLYSGKTQLGDIMVLLKRLADQCGQTG